MTMVYKALPYAIIMTIVGLVAVTYFEPPLTHAMLEAGWISDHAGDPASATGGGHHDGH